MAVCSSPVAFRVIGAAREYKRLVADWDAMLFCLRKIHGIGVSEWLKSKPVPGDHL